MRQMVCAAMLAVAACSAERDPEANAAVPAAEPSVNDIVAPGKAPAAPSGPAAESGNVSRFTTGGIEKCRLVEKNEEEGGYFRHRCPGIGGFDYEVVESDLRQGLVVIDPSGRRSDISLAPVAGGGGFSSLGPTIEWRGVAGQAPRTMTVRFNVQEDPDPKVAARSYLVLIRLTPPACPVAAIPPGPSQSNDSRVAADAATLVCLKT